MSTAAGRMFEDPGLLGLVQPGTLGVWNNNQVGQFKLRTLFFTGFQEYVPCECSWVDSISGGGYQSQSKSRTPLQTRFAGLPKECHLSKSRPNKFVVLFISLNISAAIGLTSPSFGKGSSSSGSRGGGSSRPSTSKPVSLSKPPSQPSNASTSAGGGSHQTNGSSPALWHQKSTPTYVPT